VENHRVRCADLPPNAKGTMSNMVTTMGRGGKKKNGRNMLAQLKWVVVRIRTANMGRKSGGRENDLRANLYTGSFAKRKRTSISSGQDDIK